MNLLLVKKAKTFDEEKNVAQKAPVDGITIDNLGKEKKELPKTTQSNFLIQLKLQIFIIKIQQKYDQRSKKKLVLKISRL